jgi:DNA polymerase V
MLGVSEALMITLDSINKKMGKGSLKLASAGFRAPWKMRQENKSQVFLSDWDEVVGAG